GFVNASRTSTCTAGAMVTPAVTFDGCAANDRLEAAAARTVNVSLVTDARPGLDAVSCLLPARSTLKPAKLTRPFASLRSPAPPASVPVPTSASEMDWPGRLLPSASATCTRTAGASGTPATTFDGCTTTDRPGAHVTVIE